MKETRRFAQGLAVSCILLLSAGMAFGQNDPGVRGGLSNTGGGLQQQGIPIPHPPVIMANPTIVKPINDNELASFLEGSARAGQQEHTCDDGGNVADGSDVNNLGE